MTTRHDINLYLFYEFGIVGDEALVSADWPFELQETQDLTIFKFLYEDETYFAVTNEALTFYPVEGMTVADLQMQQLGAYWLAQRDPIDLQTSKIGYEEIPSRAQRSAAIQQLIADVFGSKERMHILEGLFLVREQRYFALVEEEATAQTYLVGDGIQPQTIEFPGASGWRRLAFGTGRLFQEGKLLENPTS